MGTKTEKLFFVKLLSQKKRKYLAEKVQKVEEKNVIENMSCKGTKGYKNFAGDQGQCSKVYRG